jgi:hypothetical protein
MKTTQDAEPNHPPSVDCLRAGKPFPIESAAKLWIEIHSARTKQEEHERAHPERYVYIKSAKDNGEGELFSLLTGILLSAARHHIT